MSSFHMGVTPWQYMSRVPWRFNLCSGYITHVRGTLWVGTKAPLCPATVLFPLYFYFFGKKTIKIPGAEKSETTLRL
jgi:hypothetical protein